MTDGNGTRRAVLDVIGHSEGNKIDDGILRTALLRIATEADNHQTALLSRLDDLEQEMTGSRRVVTSLAISMVLIFLAAAIGVVVR